MTLQGRAAPGWGSHVIGCPAGLDQAGRSSRRTTLVPPLCLWPDLTNVLRRRTVWLSCPTAAMRPGGQPLKQPARLGLGRLLHGLAVIFLALSGAAGLAAAQDQASSLPAGDVRIGTRVAPPFAMKAEDGTWQGISIDLLAAVAARLDITYQLQETTLDGMIQDVASGRLDGSIAAMTMTAQREKVIDFSYAFFRSGLGVAVAKGRKPGISAIWAALTSSAFLSVLGLLMVLLLVVGAAIWVSERRSNPGQFEPDARRGLFSGFWWAVVTMTTTGYGDKAPITVTGRGVAILWMLSGLVLTSTFTAQLAASLTAHSILSPVAGPADLSRLRVGFVTDAASAEALRAYGVRPRGYPDVASGLKAVARAEIDAFVHDEPILAWEIAAVPGAVLLPLRFAPQDYAIVLPHESPMREAVNRALLDVLASDEWGNIQRRYLGGLP